MSRTKHFALLFGKTVYLHIGSIDIWHPDTVVISKLLVHNFPVASRSRRHIKSSLVCTQTTGPDWRSDKWSTVWPALECFTTSLKISIYLAFPLEVTISFLCCWSHLPQIPVFLTVRCEWREAGYERRFSFFLAWAYSCCTLFVLLGLGSLRETHVYFAIPSSAWVIPTQRGATTQIPARIFQAKGNALIRASAIYPFQRHSNHALLLHGPPCEPWGARFESPKIT